MHPQRASFRNSARSTQNAYIKVRAKLGARLGPRAATCICAVVFFQRGCLKISSPQLEKKEREAIERVRFRKGWRVCKGRAGLRGVCCCCSCGTGCPPGCPLGCSPSSDRGSRRLQHRRHRLLPGSPFSDTPRRQPAAHALCLLQLRALFSAKSNAKEKTLLSQQKFYEIACFNCFSIFENKFMFNEHFQHSTVDCK